MCYNQHMASANTPPDFSHVAVFSDLHYGMRNNSREHNIACEEFVKWFIAQATARGIKTCFFLGDYHHVRSAINISTLNYSVAGLRMLNAAFDNVYFIIGNHDLYFRDKLEIHSIPYITEFPNIHLIDRVTTVGDHTFVPWLVNDQWKNMQHIQTPYVWGHFELPRFKMNAMVEMPDHGTLNSGHFAQQKAVYSGHFHKRQQQGNIQYIGNAFPHDYSDAWDDARGMMFWKPGVDPEFQAWPGAPRYRVLPVSQLLLNPGQHLQPQNLVRVSMDTDSSYEDQQFVRDLLEICYDFHDLTFLTQAADTQELLDDAQVDFESVDTIVISHLNSIESKTIRNKTLVDLYLDL